MNRGERRDIKERKWKSRLRKLWESNFFFERIWKVKEDKSEKYETLPKAESWKDFKKDRSGVMLRNTRTPWSDKNLTIQEEHKRNLANRKLTNEEMYEVDKYMEDINNPYAFENYCGACDFFNEEECPFYGKVTEDTEWKTINCNNFFD